MLKKLSLLSALLLVTLGIFGGVSAQDGSNNEVRLVMDADNAVFHHGESGEWDGQFTVPAVVLEIDGQLHMFRNGYPNWPAPNSVGYMISDDGYTWTEVQEEPVFKHEEAPYGVDMNLLTSVIQEDDGTWAFYFFLWSNANSTAPTGIARATASSPTDPWQFDEELVLLPGSKGEWDAGSIGSTEIFKTNGGYVMYYVGGAVDPQMGMATSADGIHWEKYNDPTTTDAPFAESDPVFTAQGAETWEFNNISDLAIIPDGDGWLMFYGSMNTGSNVSFAGYNLAFSDDGLNWERLSKEPLWTYREIRRRPTWTADIINFNGELRVWMEISRTYSGDTDIFAGTIEGLAVE